MVRRLANARPPDSAKFANAPPPGLTRRTNARSSPGGGGGRRWNWLMHNLRWKNARCLSISFLNVLSLMNFYKITKIVRALWLAERSVCMRVCKHGCGVKLFGFSRANHASMNLKSFRVQNSTSLLYLPISSSAEIWKIVKKKWVNFPSLKLTF